MALLSFRSDYFLTCCGPRPRDDATRRALESNEGDSFFVPLETEGESYEAWLRRRPQWEGVGECCLLVTPGVATEWVQAACEYVHAFLPSIACRPLRVRSVENGMRFVPKQSVAGSCGEGGCRGELQAIQAHAVMSMVERTAEANLPGMVVIALTKEALYTERDGVCEFTSSSKGRIGVASFASVNGVRAAARLVMRSLCELVGFVECGWMRCVLNVLSSSEDTHLMVACPPCLRRIAGLGVGRVTGGAGNFREASRGTFGGRESLSASNFVARYEALARWFSDHCGAGANELAWIRERYFAITGREIQLGGDGRVDGTDGESGGDHDDRAAIKSGAGDRELATNHPMQQTGGEDTVSREEIRSKLKLLKRKKKSKR